MHNLSKNVAILGSTGSIGCNSLEAIENLKMQGFGINVKYLTTNTRIDKLAEQIERYSPSGVVIQDKTACDEFKNKYSFEDLEILSGREGLMEIVSRDDFNFLINALVGFSGLEPTIKSISTGKDVALANKETLVVGGKLITELLQKHGTKLLPIDSEHSAILQCLVGENCKTISKLILTASGGPFLNKSINDIRNSSVEDALAHPNWKMGNKITIDSATMMNKGLEVIEARWLFDIEVKNIEVLIHPQSIIHSMVEFIDGSVKAQLGIPDMKVPIQYAITYPERIVSDFPKIDFKKIKTLTFEEPDLQKFKCLKIAYDVINGGGTYPAVLNAANEVAVDLFLKKKIQFYRIPEIIEKELDEHKNSDEISLDNILQIDSLIRKKIMNHHK
ncbi:MAG: 1-deoxy-D-xylulose-5-phosphate reductoisomerase [Ignavibacteria bacterium]